MHGLIFLQFQRFIRRQGGTQASELVLREANLPAKSYAPVCDYPDEEALALFTAASRTLRRPAAELLEAFGAFIAPHFLRLYGRLIPRTWMTLDLIENTEPIIHAAVRAANPGARPPILDCMRTAEDEIQIMYSSDRQLCDLAKGLVKGIAAHYGETVLVTDQACMLRGDPFCALQVKRVRADPSTLPPATATDTQLQVHTPLSGAAWAAPSAECQEFPFLKPARCKDELGRLGDFRVLGLLGRGGMGFVFRAEDTRLGRLVALKVLQPKFAQDPVVQQRFLREARAMAAIRSDHVVTVHEVGVDAQTPFLAMEYLEGETLEAYRERIDFLPPSQVARIGRETALGLAAAHARGLIHRDIKPANLWLEAPAGRIKILDFGLARLNVDATPLSQSGLVVGTPAFMAPEQARGQAVDHRADLFSLGCVLYWLCTNEYPFKGTDILSTLTALATHDPAPPRAVVATVPPSVSDLIMELLQKDPAQRVTEAQTVVDRLLAVEQAYPAAGVPARSGAR
jgi:Protein kinase domain/Haem-NO-binding